jgi:hypothetical protein
VRYFSRISSGSIMLSVNIQSYAGWFAYTTQDEDGNYKLPQAAVATIKQELIGLMISVPSSVQSQLGEAVSLIAESDFWTRWDTLMDVSYFIFNSLAILTDDV